MHVAAMAIDLHIPESRSLKAKRAAIRPIIDGLRKRGHVAVSEVDHHEQWQRALIGVATVGSTASHVCDILDEVERFVWSRPDVEVLSCERRWLDGSA